MVNCKICGKETNNKTYCSNECKLSTSWNARRTLKDDLDIYNKMYSKERNIKVTNANIKTWKNEETRNRRINGILEDYKEHDQSIRNKHIGEGQTKSYLDPIKRENHLKHIKARIGNAEFSNKVKEWMREAIKNGFIPENNAYTVAKYSETLGHVIRSSWEQLVCGYLVLNNIEYIYEKQKFNLEDCFFTPDLYFPKHNFWIEITGVMRPKKKYKLEKLNQLFPSIKLYNIGSNGKSSLLKDLQQILETTGGDLG